MRFEHAEGKLRNMENNLLNRTVAEQIDDYQMRIYELAKHAHPEILGYTADCHECVTDDGEFDIHTQFFMHRPEEKGEE